jgi:hypothetical protein
MGSAGVIGYHPSEGTVIRGRGVDGKKFTLGFQDRVESSQNQPGLNANPLFLRINLQNLIHVPHEIQDNPFSNPLPCPARAPSAGSERDSVSHRVMNAFHDILAMFGLNNKQGTKGIDAGPAAIDGST